MNPRLARALVAAAQSSGAPAFSMASVAWTSWIDGPGYSAGTFTGKASAGGSGSRNYAATGTPATSTENGLATILLDGVDDYFSFTSGSQAADLISASGYTQMSVCRIDAASSANLAPYANAMIGGTVNEAIGVTSSGGLQGYQYQGGNKIAAETWAASTLVCVFHRYDGTNVSIRKGKGAWTNTASTTPDAPSGAWIWGADYTFAEHLTGEFCEHATIASALSDATCDAIADAMAARWGVSV